MILFRRYLRWSLLSVLSGAGAGLAATIFLVSLNWVTEARKFHVEWIWALPLAGGLIGWLYHRFGRDVAAGNNLIIDEIHDPRRVIPVRMAPLVLLGTLLTHLCGGSAGREGTAVQMGASLSDQLSRIFNVEGFERKVLLVAGAGAGFGAAMGAPFAGAIFGMEVIAIGRLRPFAWFECFVASYSGYLTALALGAPHSQFMKFSGVEWGLKTLFMVGLAGVAFGLAARVFAECAHFVERQSARWISYPPLRPLVGGLILVALYRLEGSYRFVGLGIERIHEAFQMTSGIDQPVFKALFTALTVGSGFKGGEFIPLVYIGATLGSALAPLLSVSMPVLAAVGFAAVFAGAANTPIACSLMAVEIFGLEIAPYVVVGCFVSYWVSGHKGIYRAQRLRRDKPAFFRLSRAD